MAHVYGAGRAPTKKVKKSKNKAAKVTVTKAYTTGTPPAISAERATDVAIAKRKAATATTLVERETALRWLAEHDRATAVKIEKRGAGERADLERFIKRLAVAGNIAAREHWLAVA